MQESDFKNKHQHGFTLIELMVVLIIVGILGAIGVPQYSAYVKKSRRSDALAALSLTQVSMERCYAQTFSYVKACTGMPTFPAASPQGYYSVAIANQTDTTFTLTATPVGTQAADATCSFIAVDQANTKTASDTSCWNP